MLCDKPTWGSTSCPSCAHHPSAGVCLHPFLHPKYRTYTPTLLRAANPSPCRPTGRHWHRWEPLLCGRVKTSGFYSTTDFPENACHIPKSLTQLSTGFPHLVLQSLEMRSVKCHGAFNVAYLQIVWTRPLLTDEQHVCCECSACSKIP